MSFTTLTERKTEKKTENINEYMREYRLKRKEHLNNLEKCHYYKKKGLPQDLIDTFGELSGLVFKLKSLYKEIVEKNPDISPKIIQELSKE